MSWRGRRHEDYLAEHTMADIPMILVSYHQSPNIEAFSAKDGSKVAKDVLPESFKLDEPRGLYLDSASGSLVVVDGGKKVSTVYVCAPDGSSSTFGTPTKLIAPSTANSVNHPFAVAFDDKGNWYVSNQDSNVVAWFQVDLGKLTATANAVAKYLKDLELSGTFLGATFVASAVSGLPAVDGSPPAVKSSDGGLGAILGPDTTGTITGGGTATVRYKVQNSVRDLAIVGDYLLVVDEPGGVIRTYHVPKGTYHGASSVAGAPGAVLASPTHLLVTADAVYVSFANQVYTAPLPTTDSPALTFSPLFQVDKGSLSGMAVDGTGNVYLANRTEQSITSYPAGFGAPNWSISVKDQPEFVLYVDA